MKKDEERENGQNIQLKRDRKRDSEKEKQIERRREAERQRETERERGKEGERESYKYDNFSRYRDRDKQIIDICVSTTVYS